MAGFRRSTLWLAIMAAVGAGCGRGAARHDAASGTTHAYPSRVPAVWPPLPNSGYISGRVATAADVAAGNAVFAACVGVVGRPLQVAIPQYALWHDPATDSLKPVIVVEAEFFDGDSMFGLRQIPGGADVMAKAADLELLGRTPPVHGTGRPTDQMEPRRYWEHPRAVTGHSTSTRSFPMPSMRSYRCTTGSPWGGMSSRRSPMRPMTPSSSETAS